MPVPCAGYKLVLYSVTFASFVTVQAMFFCIDLGAPPKKMCVTDLPTLGLYTLHGVSEVCESDVFHFELDVWSLKLLDG